MIRSLLSTATAAVLLAGAAHAETRSYDLPSFTAIDASSGLNVTFDVGPTQSVTATTEQGDFSRLVVKVEGDRLVLGKKSSGWSMGWGGNKDSFAITVTAPVISAVSASSAADVRGSGLTGDLVTIETSSGADAQVGDVSASDIRLEASSGSDIAVSGTCNTIRADASSGADIDAAELLCAAAQAEASSGSDITVYASDSLTADVSSGADVTAYGNPANVDIDESSGGDVSLRG